MTGYGISLARISTRGSGLSVVLVEAREAAVIPGIHLTGESAFVADVLRDVLAVAGTGSTSHRIGAGGRREQQHTGNGRCGHDPSHQKRLHARGFSG